MPLGQLQDRLRELVGRYAFDLDTLGHHLHLPDPIGHNVCLGADVTVGWGPGAADWSQAQTPFLRWFFRWFWNGRCPTCGGDGTLSIWHKGDPTNEFHEEPCFGCAGTGQMRPELLRATYATDSPSPTDGSADIWR